MNKKLLIFTTLLSIGCREHIQIDQVISPVSRAQDKWSVYTAAYLCSGIRLVCEDRISESYVIVSFGKLDSTRVSEYNFAEEFGKAYFKVKHESASSQKVDN